MKKTFLTAAVFCLTAFACVFHAEAQEKKKSAAVTPAARIADMTGYLPDNATAAGIIDGKKLVKSAFLRYMLGTYGRTVKDILASAGLTEQDMDGTLVYAIQLNPEKQTAAVSGFIEFNRKKDDLFARIQKALAGKTVTVRTSKIEKSEVMTVFPQKDSAYQFRCSLVQLSGTRYQFEALLNSSDELKFVFPPVRRKNLPSALYNALDVKAMTALSVNFAELFQLFEQDTTTPEKDKIAANPLASVKNVSLSYHEKSGYAYFYSVVASTPEGVKALKTMIQQMMAELKGSRYEMVLAALKIEEKKSSIQISLKAPVSLLAGMIQAMFMTPVSEDEDLSGTAAEEE